MAPKRRLFSLHLDASIYWIFSTINNDMNIIWYLLNDRCSWKQILMCLFNEEYIYRSLRNRHEAHRLGEAQATQRSRDLNGFNKRYRDSSSLAMI